MDMLLLRAIISFPFIIAANFELCFCGCARAEYEIYEECCPMCAPGNHVYWHCTVDTSTTCVPCPALTYTDEPNGLIKCFPCSVCDAVRKVKVQKACTRSADTICEPHGGFHCSEWKKGSCEFAMKHSECKPGEYINQTGTAFADTVCGNCRDGTYSNGSLLACLPHSKCDTMGLSEKKAGTTSSDAECEKVTSVAVIAGVISALVVAVTVALLSCIIYKKRTAQPRTKSVSYRPQQATEDDAGSYKPQQATEDDETAHNPLNLL